MSIKTVAAKVTARRWAELRMWESLRRIQVHGVPVRKPAEGRVQ